MTEHTDQLDSIEETQHLSIFAGRSWGVQTVLDDIDPFDVFKDSPADKLESRVTKWLEILDQIGELRKNPRYQNLPWNQWGKQAFALERYLWALFWYHGDTQHPTVKASFAAINAAEASKQQYCECILEQAELAQDLFTGVVMMHGDVVHSWAIADTAERVLGHLLRDTRTRNWTVTQWRIEMSHRGQNFKVDEKDKFGAIRAAQAWVAVQLKYQEDI